MTRAQIDEVVWLQNVVRKIFDLTRALTRAEVSYLPELDNYILSMCDVVDARMVQLEAELGWDLKQLETHGAGTLH